MLYAAPASPSEARCTVSSCDWFQETGWTDEISVDGAIVRASGGSGIISLSAIPVSPATVGRCITSVAPTDRGRIVDSLRASTTAFSELPPSSKKLASTLIVSGSTPSTAANTSLTATSKADA
eukprot:5239000-Prymnesium_polylepis.1